MTTSVRAPARLRSWLLADITEEPAGTSAAVAVTLSARRRGERGKIIGFGVVAVVFTCTTVANVFDRPEGVQVAALFILAIVLVSFASRFRRAFELRAESVSYDATALQFIEEAALGTIRIGTHDVDRRDSDEYREKASEQRSESHIPGDEPILFLEVNVRDSSEFATKLRVHGRQRDEHRILWVNSSVIPNSIAAILLDLRDRTGTILHVYFEWTEGNPVSNLQRFLFIGQGEVAPVTREVLRRAEPDVSRRPHVHVG